eukprot:gene3555-4430_t
MENQNSELLNNNKYINNNNNSTSLSSSISTPPLPQPTLVTSPTRTILSEFDLTNPRVSLHNQSPSLPSIAPFFANNNNHVTIIEQEQEITTDNKVNELSLSELETNDKHIKFVNNQQQQQQEQSNINNSNRKLEHSLSTSYLQKTPYNNSNNNETTTPPSKLAKTVSILLFNSIKKEKRRSLQFSSPSDNNSNNSNNFFINFNPTSSATIIPPSPHFTVKKSSENYFPTMTPIGKQQQQQQQQHQQQYNYNYSTNSSTSSTTSSNNGGIRNLEQLYKDIYDDPFGQLTQNDLEAILKEHFKDDPSMVEEIIGKLPLTEDGIVFHSEIIKQMEDQRQKYDSGSSGSYDYDMDFDTKHHPINDLNNLSNSTTTIDDELESSVIDPSDTNDDDDSTVPTIERNLKFSIPPSSGEFYGIGTYGEKLQNSITGNHETFKNEIKRLESENLISKENEKNANNKKKVIEEENQKLVIELNNSFDEINRLKKEVQSFKDSEKKKRDLSEELETFKKRENDLNKKFDDQKKQNLKLNEILKKREEENKQIKNENETIRQEMEIKENENKRLKNSIKIFEQNREQYLQQFNEFKNLEESHENQQKLYQQLLQQQQIQNQQQLQQQQQQFKIPQLQSSILMNSVYHKSGGGDSSNGGGGIISNAISDELMVKIENLEKQNLDISNEKQDLQQKLKKFENDNKAITNKNNELNQLIQDLESTNIQLSKDLTSQKDSSSKYFTNNIIENIKSTHQLINKISNSILSFDSILLKSIIEKPSSSTSSTSSTITTTIISYPVDFQYFIQHQIENGKKNVYTESLELLEKDVGNLNSNWNRLTSNIEHWKQQQSNSDKQSSQMIDQLKLELKDQQLKLQQQLLKQQQQQQPSTTTLNPELYNIIKPVAMKLNFPLERISIRVLSKNTKVKWYHEPIQSIATCRGKNIHIIEHLISKLPPNEIASELEADVYATENGYDARPCLIRTWKQYPRSLNPDTFYYTYHYNKPTSFRRVQNIDKFLN